MPPDAAPTDDEADIAAALDAIALLDIDPADVTDEPLDFADVTHGSNAEDEKLATAGDQ